MMVVDPLPADRAAPDAVSADRLFGDLEVNRHLAVLRGHLFIISYDVDCFL